MDYASVQYSNVRRINAFYMKQILQI